MFVFKAFSSKSKALVNLLQCRKKVKSAPGVPFIELMAFSKLQQLMMTSMLPFSRILKSSIKKS